MGVKWPTISSKIAKIAQRQGALPRDIFHDTYSKFKVRTYTYQIRIQSIKTSGTGYHTNFGIEKY